MTGRRILVIDDDESSLELLIAALRGEGYIARGVSNGLAAEAEVQDFRPDLALVDVQLGEGVVDGLTIARRLRTSSDVPLMFLTASTDVHDRLAGFAVGADDFVSKPFSFLELLARIEAVLRRAGNPKTHVVEFDDILLDRDAHTVLRDGQPVQLTAVEFALLEALMRKPGTAISKPALLSEVWGFDHYDVNIVEVYASSLRRKLEEFGPRVIHTLRGVGYVLRVPA
jgi:two-component system, OmpR family, response regulator